MPELSALGIDSIVSESWATHETSNSTHATVGLWLLRSIQTGDDACACEVESTSTSGQRAAEPPLQAKVQRWDEVGLGPAS